MASLASTAMGGGKRLSVQSTRRGVLHVVFGFYLVLISEVKFSFQTKKEQKGTKKQWAVFVCSVFLYMPFFCMPNSESECLALRGEAEGEVFF